MFVIIIGPYPVLHIGHRGPDRKWIWRFSNRGLIGNRFRNFWNMPDLRGRLYWRLCHPICISFAKFSLEITGLVTLLPNGYALFMLYRRSSPRSAPMKYGPYSRVHGVTDSVPGVRWYFEIFNFSHPPSMKAQILHWSKFHPATFFRANLDHEKITTGDFEFQSPLEFSSDSKKFVDSDN